MIRSNEDYEILENLKRLVGEKFDWVDVMCCFPGEEDVRVHEIEGTKSNFEGHGSCQLYNAYHDDINSTVFGFYVDEDDIIVEVHWEV